ncbi:hypothetical protein [Streptomyces sp. NPDC055243]|uniref:hypothetical protein n=1 Tax=Streptomyces sp. NPDC055243 TaxID=3365720 RepID=UPI0037D6C3C3
MAELLKEARLEPGGTWTITFSDGSAQTVNADWIEPVGRWVEFRSSDGLVAIARADATDLVAYTPPGS